MSHSLKLDTRNRTPDGRRQERSSQRNAASRTRSRVSQGNRLERTRRSTRISTDTECAEVYVGTAHGPVVLWYLRGSRAKEGHCDEGTRPYDRRARAQQMDACDDDRRPWARRHHAAGDRAGARVNPDGTTDPIKPAGPAEPT